MSYEDNRIKNRLMTGIQIINIFIGIVIALICILAYMTIDNMTVRIIIITLLIIMGCVCCFKLFNRLNVTESMDDRFCISKIQLVNEENEVIEDWIIGNRISFVIGKNTDKNKVFIDLKNSIYSDFIEDNHAVVNYAAGKWYIEDLSSKYGVCIQKDEDKKIYRIVHDTPCEIKKGDILFIHKVKLLLK